MDLENIDIEDMSLSSEEEAEEEVRIRKRYIRDGENPIEYFNEQEFKIKFRFTKQSVMFGILPLIKDELTKPSNRGLPISPELQLLVCLRYYATASFQVSNKLVISLYYLYIILIKLIMK